MATTAWSFIRGTVELQLLYRSRDAPIQPIASLGNLDLYSARVSSLDGMIVLAEDGGSDLAFDVGVGHVVLQLSRLDVAVDDDDAAVCLEGHGQQVAVRIDREVPRATTAGGEFLDFGEVTRRTVDRELW